MISYGERFAIVLPSIFYFVISIINTLEFGKLIMDIGPIVADEKEKEWLKKIKVISKNIWVAIFSGTFLEFIILSITNGLSIIFVLNEHVIGAFFMIIGLIISLFGFTYVGVEKHFALSHVYEDTNDEKEKKASINHNENKKRNYNFIYSHKIDRITTMLSIGEIGYIGSYGINVIDVIPVEYVPWCFFIAGLIFGYFFDKYILNHFYP